MTDQFQYRPLKRRSGSEHQEQAAFFSFVWLHSGRYPLLEWIHSIPNWTPKESDRLYLSAEGMTAGILDVFIPIPRAGFAGFYIEFKAGRNEPTDDQRAFALFAIDQGYRVDIHRDWLEAARALFDYLDLPFPAVI